MAPDKGGDDALIGVGIKGISGSAVASTTPQFLEVQGSVASRTSGTSTANTPRTARSAVLKRDSGRSTGGQVVAGHTTGAVNLRGACSASAEGLVAGLAGAGEVIKTLVGGAGLRVGDDEDEGSK